MTKAKADAKIVIGSYVNRRHFAVRMREDILKRLRVECCRLNCSQGVYLELLLSKGLASGLVRDREVFAYVAVERAAHSVYSKGDARPGHLRILKRVVQRGSL